MGEEAEDPQDISVTRALAVSCTSGAPFPPLGGSTSNMTPLNLLSTSFKELGRQPNPATPRVLHNLRLPTAIDLGGLTIEQLSLHTESPGLICLGKVLPSSSLGKLGRRCPARPPLGELFPIYASVGADKAKKGKAMTLQGLGTVSSPRQC